MSIHVIARGLVLFACSLAHASGDQDQEWVWRNPLPQANYLSGVAASGHGFIAVGSLGTIVCSSNGIHWVLSSSPTRNHLRAVTYADGLLVAVGEGGIVLRSEDNGETWAVSESKTTNWLTSVTYGDHQFVAVGDRATILSSPDGISWTDHSLGTNFYLNGAAHGNGIYVTVSWGGEILTSPDGEHWNINDLSLSGPLYTTAHGGNRFVVIGYDGAVLLSDDGEHWFRRTVSAWRGDLRGVPLIHVNGCFVTSVNGRIYKSADGEEWIEMAQNTVVGSEGLAYGQGVYVTVGYYGQSWSSTNLLEWASGQTVLTPHPTQLWEVFFGGGIFLATGAEYSATIGNYLFLTSRDGVQWITNTTGPVVTFGKNSFAYGNGMFVAIGSARYAYTSTDGVNWPYYYTGTDYRESLNGIAYGSNVFVVAGGDYFSGPGFVLTSTNGTNWNRREIPPARSALLASAYGNDTFVVAGRDGRILRSTDTISWSEQQSGTSATLDRIVFGNGRFVVTGRDPSTVLCSPDGSNWLAVAGLPVTGPVVFGAGTFLAAAERGRFLTSIDGMLWNERNGLASPSVLDLTFGNDTFVAVGNDGTILQTTSKWRPSIQLRWPKFDSNPDLVVAGVAGRTYLLEYLSGLTPHSEWRELTNLNLLTSPQSWTDTCATRTNGRIYRATLLP